ncbi:MAG: hypothetical protein HPY58_13720 [Firmicutes bacterium]|nr:hypothetical protein [Bacillota bacterium]
MPEKISAIAGLRGMFRQTGGVIGTAGIVLVLSRFPDKVAGFRAVFLGMSALLLLAMPLIRLVPDGRGAAGAGPRGEGLEVYSLDYQEPFRWLSECKKI